MNKTVHQHLFKIVNVTISLSLIIGLIYWLDWRQALSIISKSNIAWLVLASVLMLTVYILDGLRLHWMIPLKNFALLTHIRIALQSVFISQLGFGMLSGEAYRATAYSINTGTTIEPVMYIIASRVAGIISLGVTATIIIFWLLKARLFENPELGSHIMITLLYFIAGILFLWVIFMKSMKTIKYTFPNWIITANHSLNSVTPRVWILSFVIISVRGLSFTCIVYAADVPVNFYVPILASIIATLSNVLPLALGGLGFKESALAGTISLFGVPFTIAMSTAILMRLVLVFTSITGLLLSLIKIKGITH